jgi:hypothetical protein
MATHSVGFGRLLVAALLAAGSAAAAADTDPCTQFRGDVTHTLEVMAQTPQALTAASAPGSEVPLLETDAVYALRLLPQDQVTFAVTPGKPTLADGSQAGLVRFRVDEAGRYRIAITSVHWIDVVDGTQVVQSGDFQGQRGCARLHKIVEFDLPAGRDLVLQFSGAAQAEVNVSVTPAPAEAAAPAASANAAPASAEPSDGTSPRN